MTPVVIVGDRIRTRDEEVERGARLAAAMHAAGVGAGDAVALLLRNDFAVLEANLAVRRLDAYGVPVNWHWHADEIGYVLRDCAPRLLIGHHDLLEAIEDRIPAGLTVVAIGGDPSRGWIDYDDWIASHESHSGAGTGLGSSMVYTSGTTGRPKAVRRLPASGEESAQRARVLAAIHDSAPGNVALVTGPLYHLFGQALMTATFGAGGSVVIMERFDPEACLALIERHRITHSALVPTLFVRLLRLPDAVKARYDLSSLRHVVHSGAPCAPEVKRAMLGWWGPVLHETYGSTETGVVTKIGPAEWLERPGSVGRPVLTGEVRIRGEDGDWAPAGTVGDVYLRIHGTPDFTFHGDPAKRAAVEYDGLITCGDIGWLDEEGYLFLCDRRVDMVISGGVNIYPAEIEAALLEHQAIGDCAVFGVPDAEYGETPVAFVEPVGAIDAGAVRAFLRGRLAGYKVPRHIVVTDRLPREETGKIMKRKLREQFLATEQVDG
ncbi:AMP-binding protein [Sphingomonas histidinilytica]|uniref:Long-chain acyl-CoA synthetase n=1 Tax=Rhizorhabdus histidinilytica TaxID=439228 RepID=A0A1T5A3J1_9SPHN|nr:AMP-binding protein [Rhizorhabdus histidinilytica]MBO9376151.1 AMP-binding protein [Rhizorhabdus histidinilytica]SKB29544.1 long-chain acyl-CoA synthetase [Rhizorhabdus histidinilytica]